MHNLKKYFGILDYALRVFSKCFPLYEIPLNISTLFRPVHCVSFYKIAFKRSSLYEAHIDKSKNSVKNKRNCPLFFENLLWVKSFECKAFFTKYVELLRRKLSSISSNSSLSIEITHEIPVFNRTIFKVFLKEVNLRFVSRILIGRRHHYAF